MSMKKLCITRFRLKFKKASRCFAIVKRLRAIGKMSASLEQSMRRQNGLYMLALMKCLMKMAGMPTHILVTSRSACIPTVIPSIWMMIAKSTKHQMEVFSGLPFLRQKEPRLQRCYK